MPTWKIFLVDGLEFIFRFLRWISKPITGFFLRVYFLSGFRLSCNGSIPASTQFDGVSHLIGTKRLVLGDYCRIGKNVLFETEGNGEIVVGSNVRINSGTVISARTRITIGNDALIGEYVSIRDSNHGTGIGLPMRLQPHKGASINIGQDVWIGRGCCVLSGVAIGDGAVIGANSVVVKNIEGLAVYAGVPVRKISSRGV